MVICTDDEDVDWTNLFVTNRSCQEHTRDVGEEAKKILEKSSYIGANFVINFDFNYNTYAIEMDMNL